MSSLFTVGLQTESQLDRVGEKQGEQQGIFCFIFNDLQQRAATLDVFVPCHLTTQLTLVAALSDRTSMQLLRMVSPPGDSE